MNKTSILFKNISGIILAIMIIMKIVMVGIISITVIPLRIIMMTVIIPSTIAIAKNILLLLHHLYRVFS